MQIFVRLGFGWKKVWWDVEPSNTIQDIKEIVYDREGIPSYIYSILHRGILTFDNQTISELNTTSNAYYFIKIIEKNI